MEHPNLGEQDDCHAAAFALADLRTKLPQESFDIAPLDVGAGRASEDGFKRALVLPLHALHGTTIKYRRFRRCPQLSCRFEPVIMGILRLCGAPGFAINLCSSAR